MKKSASVKVYDLAPVPAILSPFGWIGIIAGAVIVIAVISILLIKKAKKKKIAFAASPDDKKTDQ